MKTIKLLALLLTTASLAFAQDFEGKIMYKNEYKSKIPVVPNDQLSAMMGETQEYAMKGGDYKSTTNGTLLQWQLYINKDNKLYSKFSNTATIFWNDGAVSTDEVVKAEINKGVVEILGRKCDELVLTCKNGIQKFYFSSEPKVNPKWFENHKFANWNEIISKTHSMPLKMIIDVPQFSVESVATEILPMKLESKLFELPADSKLEKSPY